MSGENNVKKDPPAEGPKEKNVPDGHGVDQGHPEHDAVRKPEPPKPARYIASTNAMWLAWVAIVVALASMAGVVGLGWAWYQVRGMDSQVIEMQGTVNGLKDQLQTLSGSAATKNQLAQLEQAIQKHRHSQMAFNAAIRREQETLKHEVADGLTSYREQEAASLMRIAGYRLNLGQDVQGATSAMVLARQALAGLAGPRLMAVRSALDKEIEALRAVPTVDVAALYAKLEAISHDSTTLPLAQQRFLGRAESATQVLPKSWWARIETAFRRAFSPLFVVRHGPRARPILAPRQAYFVRAELRLMIGQAEMALLRANAPVYQGSLREAQLWITKWFNTSAPTVKTTLSQLSQLRRVDLSPPLPKLGQALDLLQGTAGKPA